MPRCIAFLRAVNVGGRTVNMDALRAAFEALGLTRVETFIASGNVIFDTRARSLAALERKIEAHLHAAHGFEIHTFIRTDDALAAIAGHSAFDAAAVAGAGAFVVVLLAAAPDAAGRKVIEGFGNEVDRFHLRERELYWLSTGQQSESTFSNAAFEKALQMRATFRSMSTVRKLVAKLSST